LGIEAESNSEPDETRRLDRQRAVQKRPRVGLLGRRLPFARLLLDETADRLDRRVDALVEAAVDPERRRDADGATVTLSAASRSTIVGVATVCAAAAAVASASRKIGGAMRDVRRDLQKPRAGMIPFRPPCL
jgi:hypothetical protein